MLDVANAPSNGPASALDMTRIGGRASADALAK